MKLCHIHGYCKYQYSQVQYITTAADKQQYSHIVHLNSCLPGRGQV